MSRTSLILFFATISCLDAAGQSMLPVSYFPAVITGLGSLFASDWVLSLSL